MKETIVSAGRILRDYFATQLGANLTEANIHRLCSVATDLLPGEKYGQVRSLLALCERYHAFKKYTEGNLDWTARAKSVLHIMHNDAMLAKNFALCATALVVMICDGKEEGEKHAMAILSPGGNTQNTQPNTPQQPQAQPTQPVQTQPTQRPTQPTQPQATNSQPTNIPRESNRRDFEISGSTLIKYGGKDEIVVVPSDITTIAEFAFLSCSTVKRVIFPSGLTTIKHHAFWSAINLESIVIPKSVTKIEYSLFPDCSNLASITVESGNPYYHSANNCLIETATRTLVAGCKNSIIPTDGSVTAIGEGAFGSCRSLTNINLPSGIRSIGDFAFEQCSSLQSITIPVGVTTIGKSAFSSCYDLKTVVLPEGITTIGDNAFNVCKSLTSITIPASVTSIGRYVFYAEGLSNITVQSGNRVYNSAGNCLIETATKTLIKGCKNSTIPSDGSVTVIGPNAFSSCESLTRITIPNTITRIESDAFNRCSGLTSVIIPDSVKSIGRLAFYLCTNLREIRIPDNISLASDAFRDCPAFKV